MDPLSITASITAIATAAFQIVQILNSIITGGKDRIRLLHAITALWMSVTSLKSQIAPDGVPSEEMSYETVMPFFEPGGIIADIESEIERLEKKLKKQAGHGKLRQTLAWPLDQKDVDRTVEHLHHLQQTLNFSLNQSSHALSREIHRDGIAVKSAMEGLQIRSLIDWLSPLNFIAKQDLLYKEHHEGTCKWFLESDEFRQWKEGENSMLFCPGIPGAGKTFLSSIATNDLGGMRTNQTQRENIAVLNLYCKWDDPQSQTIDGLLCSLLKQVVQKYGTASEGLIKMFNEHQKKETRPSRTELQNALGSELSPFKRTFMVVDGLDELLEEKNRLTLLETLTALPGKVNVMVTSRPLKSIVRHFADFYSSNAQCDVCEARALRYQHRCLECEDLVDEGFQLCQECVDKGKRCYWESHDLVKQFSSFVIDIMAVEEDLEIYVQTRIQTSDFLRQCVKKKNALLPEILDNVVYATNGMFLLAKFHMDTLASKLTPGAVSAALRTLPKELDGIYAEAMERIQDLQPSHKDIAMYFLQWVAYAEEPLQMREIEHAIAVAEGTHEIDNDDIILADSLTSFCAGLVVFDETSRVRLVHYSAENYFKHHRDKWFPEGHTKLASVCLTYLLFDAFKDGPCSGPDESADFDARIEKYPLLGYASMHWGEHLLQTTQVELSDRVMSFLTSDNHLAASIQALWYLDDRNSQSWADKHGASALHLATHFGIDKIVTQLLQKGADPNAKDSNGATPLILAAQTGNAVVARTLIQEGAYINATDNIGSTALHCAANLDNVEIVELLLKQDGIDINMPHARWNHHSALMLAAKNGYVDVIQKFLPLPQLDIEQEATAPRGQNALMKAATRGHADAVRILLSHPKTNINHQDRHGYTSLILSAMHGDIDVVQVLLDKGADTEVTETPAGGDGTALNRAIDYNHVSVVQLLVERGANIHHKDIFDRGMLHSAAVNGREEILRILLELDNGLDVNAQDINGKTTLHDAARFGYYGTIKILLEFGGNPLIKDKGGRTPLRVAREQNWQNIFDLLITAQAQQKEKASVDTGLGQLRRTDTGTILKYATRTDTDGSLNDAPLPLWTLAELDQTEEINSRLSSSSPPDVNVKDPDMGQTPLHWASSRGHIGTVRLLISSGADLNTSNNYGRTPLHLAAMAGRVAIARLLLQKGAEIDKTDIWEATPLYSAMNEGNWRTAVLFIQEGANIADERYRLHLFLEAAASQGNEVAVKRLIAAGAEVQRKNNQGRTPYMIARNNGHEKVANILLEQTRSPLPSPMPSPELGRGDFAGSVGSGSAVQIAVTDHGDGDQKAEVVDREEWNYGMVLDPSLEPKKASRRERSQSRREGMEELKKEVGGSLETGQNHGRNRTETETTKTAVEVVRMDGKETWETQEPMKVMGETHFDSNAHPRRVATSSVGVDQGVLMILAALTVMAVTTLVGRYIQG